MYCYKCGTKNCSNINFCYKCGAKFFNKFDKNFVISLKIKDDITLFNLSLYSKIINSKNKYISVFLLMLSFILSASFLTVICKKFPQNFVEIIELLYNNNYIAPSLYKGYVEQCFRDLWCRLFLIIIFILIIILDIFVFFKLLKWYKNKKY